MARRPSGQIVEKQTQRGTVYAVRIMACGKREYVTLGAEADGWSRARAESERDYIAAQIQRGE